MAEFKESIFDGVKVRRAAVSADDVVRKGELDAELALRPTNTELNDALIAQAHDAVTVADSNSIDLTLSGQEVSADLSLVADSELQAAGTANLDIFGSVEEGETLALSKQAVTVTSVVRKNSGGSTVATGVLTTDYEVNSSAGTVYIPAGSNLITAPGDTVEVTANYAQVKDGSGLVVDANGTSVDWGTAHHEVARGDHVHANDHKAATGGSTDSAEVTVSPGQVVTVDVTPKPGGSLEVTGTGLDVKSGVFASSGHSHSNATTGAAGFMSAADKTKLDGLDGADPTFNDTDTVNFTVNGSQVEADVKFGAGLIVGTNGLEVDVEALGPSTGYPTPERLHIVDDFVGGTPTVPGELGWLITNGAGTGLFAYDASAIDSLGQPHFGVFKAQSGATSGNWSYLSLAQTPIIPDFTGLGEIRVGFIFKLASISDVRLYIGLMDVADMDAPMESVFLRFDTTAGVNDDGTGKFRFVCVTNMTATATPMALSADTKWHYASFKLSGTSAFLSLDGSEFTEISTNVPTGGTMFPLVIIGTDTNSRKGVYLDWFGLGATGLTRNVGGG